MTGQVDPPAPVDPVRVRLRRLFLDGPGGYQGAAKRLGCERQELYLLVQGEPVSEALAHAIEREFKIKV